MADDWRTQDVEAMFDGDPGPRIARRGGALLPRPLHAQRAARHVAALGRRPPARQRHALRRDLARDRRQHRDDHPDRVVAQPRRGRLPRDARHARRRVDGPARPPTPPAARGDAERLRLAIPNKGRLVEPTLRAPPRRGAGLRGARSEPRRARPELRARHPVRPHERHHRVRRRRRRRPRDHGHRPPRARPARSCRGSATLGYGRCRLAAAVPNDPRTRRSRTSPACASRPRTRIPPAGSSRTAASPSRSSRSPAPSRSRHGSDSPRRSSTSSRRAPPS